MTPTQPQRLENSLITQSRRGIIYSSPKMPTPKPRNALLARILVLGIVMMNIGLTLGRSHVYLGGSNPEEMNKPIPGDFPRRVARSAESEDGAPIEEDNPESERTGRSNQFPVPRVENVYQEWKPVDNGHPLRDVTLTYRVPALERVSLSQYDSHYRQEHGRSGDSLFHQPSLVVPATPKEVKKHHGYSVYGSPDINYSQLYDLPIHQLPSHNEHLPGSREPPISFHRQAYNSAAASRSADEFNEPSQAKRREGIGGGFQYIEPPNRHKSNDYFYYTEDSPYYQAKLSIRPSERQDNIEDFDAVPRPFVPKPVYVRLPRPAPSKPAKGNANAVVYSFKSPFGQKKKVGVIFDDTAEQGPQFNNIFSSNEELIRENATPSPVKTIPLNHTPPTRPPNSREPSHQDIVSGVIHHVHHDPKTLRHIPLKREPIRVQSFPLGNPRNQESFQARPDFFPVQNHPPIYRTRPSHLEGQFGPAIPPKPEPTRIHFHDEEEEMRLMHKTPRIVIQTPEERQAEAQVVYKTVRDMDYAQPQKIMQVKESGELFHAPEGREYSLIPLAPGANGPEPHLLQQVEDLDVAQSRDSQWLPDFSDAIDGVTDDVNEPLDSFAARPSSTTKRPNVVFKEQSIRTVVPRRPTRPSFAFPKEKAQAKPKRPSFNPDPFAFKEEPSSKIKSVRRPIRQNPTQRPIQRDESTSPQYSIVVGANYDDNDFKDNVDDDHISIDDGVEENQKDKQQPQKKGYSPQELYELCIKEVPEYLKEQLCQHVLDKKQTRKIDNFGDRVTGSVEPLSVGSVSSSINKKASPSKPPVQETGPSVIQTLSKVKVYKPGKEEKTVSTTTKATVVSSTTLKTTTDPPTSTSIPVSTPVSKPSPEPLVASTPKTKTTISPTTSKATTKLTTSTTTKPTTKISVTKPSARTTITTTAAATTTTATTIKAESDEDAESITESPISLTSDVTTSEPKRPRRPRPPPRPNAFLQGLTSFFLGTLSPAQKPGQSPFPGQSPRLPPRRKVGEAQSHTLQNQKSPSAPEFKVQRGGGGGDVVIDDAQKA
ncbi:hypothetical protein TCAL_15294 [Tigriopus californicus]|uniref:Uncharacterized protein n=1 Tax=Tigriopus californicus TaxID=6832 RepID=A0A553PKC2_TIGCA|nr:uncharacterized protein LOC131891213 [Tigriopus californicus]TRY78127.1 hypothetical protein TCAL_15294 [Tigriopus californicus]